MDALSAVLAPVRLQRTRWVSTVGRAPWGVALPVVKSCIRFHYVVRGSAWLNVDKTDEPRVALSGGDLAVLPLGHAHALRDHPRSTPRSFEEVARCATHATHGVIHIDLGAKGPETTFITGGFVLDDPLATPILAALPPLIRMTPDAEQAVPSFLENIQFITREIETNRPGSEIVLLRMADVMFIQILRAYLARLPEGGGFLGALRDPSTAAALGVMHRRAEEPWTVASLAKEAGVSRSVFAARFTELVGEPPLGYLTRLRMQKAAVLLREGAALAKVSRLTGYSSEASFSHAFRKWAGMAPGAWRRHLESSDSSAASDEGRRALRA
ncbi:AraC family transcriptional regulator [Polyangium sp. y55x31]|uniref:AraC family transcriptional regulator n=1 Tax=Polyangium sp. y55x31 TaxID=3042688 RepID=UPI002482C312|nr:AraC family transcriptional regulator [Polyangium sp. y55x31]MDI1476792.1 AraC family transcriptional regulator [Polyangium sp. y55x31]